MKQRAAEHMSDVVTFSILATEDTRLRPSANAFRGDSGVADRFQVSTNNMLRQGLAGELHVLLHIACKDLVIEVSSTVSSSST